MARVCLLLMALVGGCSVSVPQLENLQRHWAADSAGVDEASEGEWLAVIGDSRQVLSAELGADGSLRFTNSSGSELTFDGLLVRRIVMFDSYTRHIEFRDTLSNGLIARRVWVNYRPGDEWLCTGWREGAEAGLWLQACDLDGVRFVNRRVVDELGRLVRLEQVLDRYGRVLVLGPAAALRSAQDD